jgi:hypothetical protein
MNRAHIVRRGLPSAAGALALAVVTTACGAGSAADESGTARLGTSPGSATGAAPQHGAANGPSQHYSYRALDALESLDSHVQGDRLAHALAIRQSVLLTTPASGFAPAVTRQQAYANYVKEEGQLPDTIGVRPRIFLARLTDSDMATAGASERLIPKYHGTPVWVIAYHGVRGNGSGESGGGDPTGAETPDATPDVNVTGFVDASTGTFLFDVEDTITQPVPDPTSSP